MREFEAVLSKWAKRRWPIPLWTEAVEFTGTLSATDTTINIDTQYTSFTENKYALVWQRLQQEIVVTSTVAAGQLSLVDGLVNTYTEDTWIVPLKFGFLNEISKVEDSPTAMIFEAVWIDDTLVDITGFVADQTYDSLTVITSPSLFITGKAERSENPDIFFHDYHTGPFAVVSNATYNETFSKHKWRIEERQGIWELRQFFHDVKGSQVAFLEPTFNSDLILSRAAGSGDSTIYVTDEQYTPNMEALRLRNYVAFYTGGSLIVRKVNTIADAGADESLALDATVGAAFPIGTELCWVDKCRILDDEIVLQWESQNVITCTVSLVRV
jgi:hypothetical protein